MQLWHTLSVDAIEAEIQAKEATERGLNRLQDKETSAWWKLALRQFQSPLIVILLVAAAVSFAVGKQVDSLTIFAIIGLNAVLGFVQEWKAEAAIEHLKKMLAPHCLVVRDGQVYEIEAQDLIPGDKVRLTAGSTVPADLRLVSVYDLKIDEASLTGESEVVDKSVEVLAAETAVAERNNMAWMGTNVTGGHGEGVVVAIGMETEFGRIAGITGAIKETETHLQRHLARLAKQLGILALGVSLLVVGMGVLSGKETVEMLMTGISLAIAAVPEGLPAVVTITLALGAGAMARKKALLRNLQAAETLGAVSVICTDKTGTITKNEMTVRKIWTHCAALDVEGIGYRPEGGFAQAGQRVDVHGYADTMALLRTGFVCNHARVEQADDGEWKALGNPTEAALVVAAHKAGVDGADVLPLVHEIPFSSDTKWMAVVEEATEGGVVHVKGAPEVLLEHACYLLRDGQKIPLTPALKQEIREAWKVFASEGLRILALAREELAATQGACGYSGLGAGLVFLGFVGMMDPPREEVADAIAKAHSAGIKVIMITGDSPETAMAVARQIGLEVERALTSQDMQQMSDTELGEALAKPVLFARVVPQDKFRIVKLLQAQGYLTAMTGDGVNDAPALKQADIGIAMGIRGTDVAKGAADIVLADDNFSSIVLAVEEGRRQFANITKFVRFLIAHNAGEVVAVFVGTFIGGPLVLQPVQILWVNLVTDGITALALSAEKAENTVMQHPPRDIEKPILDRSAIGMLAVLGVYVGGVALGGYYLLLGESYALANTMAVTVLVVSAQIMVFSFRSLQDSLCSIGWFANKWLWGSVAAMLSLHVFAMYNGYMQSLLHMVPLEGKHWLGIFIAVLPLVAVLEGLKAVRKKQSGKHA